MVKKEIKNIVEKLIHVDNDILAVQSASLQVGNVVSKIVQLHQHESGKLRELMKQRKKLLIQRRKHYSGRMPAEHYAREPLPEAIPKVEIKDYIDVDPYMVEIDDMISEQDDTVEWLENMLKRAHNRGFDFSNYKDLQKMING